MDGVSEESTDNLSGEKEVPKVNSTAKGVAGNSKKVNLTWKINITGLTNATGAQLYLGNNSIDVVKAGS